ncbi:hypothetical protein WQQ_44700 [Hydrocarboniphaga effusa AP103]|jgi:hypothetical protein|uniref:DUF3047 domain-containing protein n=1 Tax=Hydrocarboniphaga effusa AP103 TaxID=1172194 RepID=I8T2B2_9GAMM|nr:hypothetical protein WQQ_44700 [Hydrocarboniphaga effusa AP103]
MTFVSGGRHGRLRAVWLAVWLAVAAGSAQAAVPLSKTTVEAFDTQFRQAVAPLAGKSVRDAKVLQLSADVDGWLDTGMALDAGDRVTIVVGGTVWLSRAYQLGLDQPLVAWARIGARGPVFHGTRHTDTFTADRGGTLQLKTFPTRWLSRDGRYLPQPQPFNADGGGTVSVGLIRWARQADPVQALATLDAASAPWVQAERERLAHPPTVPAGWSYLWELGPAEIFHERSANGDGGPRRRMDVHTQADVAILQRPTDQALTDDLKLSWRWKVDMLPGLAAEDTAATHDYLSIAVEFDNGRDLTYLWSRKLPAGTHFACPLEAWADRETHIVARSGEAELGRWLSEERSLLKDYAKAVGGPPPKRVVRVWLIANSVFGRGEGKAEFGDIRLATPSHTATVW